MSSAPPDTSANVFTVNGPPTIASVSPTTVTHGASATVTIIGTNFDSGSALATSFSGTGISIASGPTYVSSTQITVGISVTAGASKTARTLTLTNGDGTTAIKASAITVN